MASDLMFSTTDKFDQIRSKVICLINGFVKGQALLRIFVGEQTKLSFIFAVTPFNITVNQI